MSNFMEHLVELKIILERRDYYIEYTVLKCQNMLLTINNYLYKNNYLDHLGNLVQIHRS